MDVKHYMDQWACGLMLYLEDLDQKQIGFTHSFGA